MKTVLFVVPVFNEALNLTTFLKSIQSVELPSCDYQICFIDDGSTDHSWEIIEEFSRSNLQVYGVRLSRNFGKESALLAGLDSCEADAAIIIDCDGQHPIETAVQMINIWIKGNVQIVEARKKTRNDSSFIYSYFARMFYSLFSYLSKLDFENATDFRLLDASVVRALKSFPERNFFFRGLSTWVGFKRTTVEFDVLARVYGHSGWSIWKLTSLALNSITAFSSFPLQLVTGAGVVFLGVSVLIFIRALIVKFQGASPDGYTILLFTQLFAGSMMMISMGIVGGYIGRIYEEVKSRPRFLISETTRSQRGRK
ncbi:MAG: glycosyltransferase family 2 protein [Xanthomonadaceae bacterium]|nr:glycosyltransferase family 2 protein [Xanthomonadaceae bacterium]